MEHPFRPCSSRPEIPDTLPVPGLELGASLDWYELEEPDDVDVYVTFTGAGRPPDSLYLGWLYVLARTESELRRPTLDEIYAAAECCPLDGVMWELPPFRGGHLELDQDADGLMVHFRQMGAEQGTPAHNRYSLSAGVIQRPQGVH